MRIKDSINVYDSWDTVWKTLAQGVTHMATASDRKLNRKSDTIAVLAALTVPIFETPKKLFPKWVEVNGKMECCWVEVEHGSR